MTQRTHTAFSSSPEHHPGDVWKTDGGKWRAISPSGNAQSFDNKDQADVHAKGKESEAPKKDAPKKEAPAESKDPPKKDAPKKDDHGGGHGDDHGGGGSLKSLVTSFLGKMKNVPKAAQEFVKAAPEKVQKFIADAEHRKTVTSAVAKGMKDGAKAIPGLISKATKDELAEIKTGVGAVRKVFKKPPEKLTSHDKKALYAVGAYVAGGVIAGATGGAALVAGGFGKAFLKHVAFKSVSHILDRGFTHFEVGETALHGLHTFTHALHMASTRKAGEEAEGDDDLNEILVTYIHEALRQVLSKGLSDDDLQEILSSMDGGGDAKEASLRSRTIRLAAENPHLRAHLLPLLKG